MHELGITRNIVAICTEHCAGKKVTRVALSIGKLSAIMPRAIEFCFDIAAAGTPCEGARLEIEEIEGRAKCKSCEHEELLESMRFRCQQPACDGVLAVIAGEELKIKEMETA